MSNSQIELCKIVRAKQSKIDTENLKFNKAVFQITLSNKFEFLQQYHDNIDNYYKYPVGVISMAAEFGCKLKLYKRNEISGKEDER